MNRKIIIVGILALSCLISSCSSSPETSSDDKGDKKVVETPIKDFSRIAKLTQSTKTQDLDRIVKILFYESSDMQNKNAVAIDIGNKGMYLNPEVSKIGLVSPDYKMSESDVEEVQHIIKENNIQSWKEDYSNIPKSDYEDGYGWVLYLEYADRTVERHSGSGIAKSEVVPKNFNSFVEEITNFVNSKKTDLDE
ncbi:hypothetical protein [Listeria booriae]|uniref:Lipoprotein n=1 Tax=Listeria booriae TaxID=1552123 RepID=A0A7X0XDM6_9LIST|nr:hypothetical protein [Listeria booriae]MBC1492224.1 hypothetical protein [Listeria booriae]